MVQIYRFMRLFPQHNLERFLASRLIDCDIKYFSKEKFGYMGCIKCFGALYEIHHLRELVEHYENGFMP